MEIDFNAVTAHLVETRAPIEELRAPHTPGVYAIFARSEGALSPFVAGPHGLLYVGTSGDLAERESKQHFNSSNTGFSTLRRTLGAILKARLRLRAVPRSPGSKSSMYRFLPEDEDRLTAWMRSNLLVAVCGIGRPSEFEGRLIAHLEPPLNLTKWPNPQRSELKRLRKACAEEAQWRSARG